jgi:hypothetical protein
MIERIKSLSMGENFGICQEKICRYLGNSQKICSSVLIAKHLDASDTLSYDILLKEKIKRIYTAFTSDYPLHI